MIFILGALVGIIMALTGAGGGILAVPLLVFWLHLTVEQAAPLALLSVGIAASVGAGIGLRSGTVRYRAALWIGAVGIVFAPFGVWLSHRLYSSLLHVLFGVILLAVAYRTYLKAGKIDADNATLKKTGPPCLRDGETHRFIWTCRCTTVLALIGAVAGLLSGLLGVGGGFVIIPALQRTTDLAMESIVPTSLAVIALVSLAGVVSSVGTGAFDISLAIGFAAGSAAGMIAGRLVASRLAGAVLQRGFAIVCLVVAIWMIAGGVG